MRTVTRRAFLASAAFAFGSGQPGGCGRVTRSSSITTRSRQPPAPRGSSRCGKPCDKERRPCRRGSLPQNNSIPGSDPPALRVLVAGEIEFFTLMGGARRWCRRPQSRTCHLLSSAAHAHRAMDGPLGAYLREEMAAKASTDYRRRVRQRDAGDHGSRSVPSRTRRSRRHQDAHARRATGCGHIQGVRRRAGHHQQRRYLRRAEGRPVDAQENPFALVEQFKLYKVVRDVERHQSHVVGVQRAAHLSTWQRIPDDLQPVIDRNVTKHVRLQRRDQAALNASCSCPDSVVWALLSIHTTSRRLCSRAAVGRLRRLQEPAWQPAPAAASGRWLTLISHCSCSFPFRGTFAGRLKPAATPLLVPGGRR